MRPLAVGPIYLLDGKPGVAFSRFLAADESIEIRDIPLDFQSSTGKKLLPTTSERYFQSKDLWVLKYNMVWFYAFTHLTSTYIFR